MSKTTQSTFMKLYKTDVSKYTEKKGKFNYLSWAYAVQELKRACPTARWGVTKAEDGSPFFVTECGYFVDVWVEVDGISLSQIHPVLDNRNQPIEKPKHVGILHMPGGHTFYGRSYISVTDLTGREEGTIRGIKSELWLDDGTKEFDQVYRRAQKEGTFRAN